MLPFGGTRQSGTERNGNQYVTRMKIKCPIFISIFFALTRSRNSALQGTICLMCSINGLKDISNMEHQHYLSSRGFYHYMYICKLKCTIWPSGKSIINSIHILLSPSPGDRSVSGHQTLESPHAHPKLRRIDPIHFVPESSNVTKDLLDYLLAQYARSLKSYRISILADLVLFSYDCISAHARLGYSS